MSMSTSASRRLSSCCGLTGVWLCTTLLSLNEISPFWTWFRNLRNFEFLHLGLSLFISLLIISAFKPIPPTPPLGPASAAFVSTSGAWFCVNVRSDFGACTPWNRFCTSFFVGTFICWFAIGAAMAMGIIGMLIMGLGPNTPMLLIGRLICIGWGFTPVALSCCTLKPALLSDDAENARSNCADCCRWRFIAWNSCAMLLASFCCWKLRMRCP
mmetsp:Transcript_19522/g.47680  ORF Transcript_19522/g.47680 Transcript_19522/m.47680 type:complete len:213 (+) Transcript_19522:1295-1933(+)